MLAVEVEYLLGRVFAGSPTNRNQPEWPPHPARLFSAMVAAYYEDGLGEEARRALQWLECQEPPVIAAGRAGRPSVPTAFVPTNYGNREKQARTFPAQSPESPVVHFVWRDADPSVDQKRVLTDLVERVGYLGRSASLVRATVVDQPPAAVHYEPSEDGEYVLRIIQEGRLEELERLHDSGRWEWQTEQLRYGRVAKPGPRAAAFDELVILRPEGGPVLGSEATLTLTERLRRALIKLSDGSETGAEYFGGHGAHPHCAFVGLPIVGNKYADGRVLGLGIAIPTRATPSQRLELRRLIGLLTQLNLGETLGCWRISSVSPKPLQKTLDVERWIATRGAREWVSVTPVLLDQFPKPKKGRTIPTLVLEACARMGLPEPIEIEYGTFGLVEGAAPVSDYRIERSKGPKRFATHVRLRFNEPIRGPLTIGAGRYFGLGLLWPVPGGKSNDD